MKTQSKKPNPTVIVALLLFGAAFFAYLAIETPGTVSFSSRSPKAISQKVNDLSNSHLFLTSKQIELEQERRRLENLQLANQAANQVIEHNPYPENYGVNHSIDRNEMTAYEDLRRYEPEVQATSPSYEIQTALFEKQKMAEYSEAYKKEYARQFVENARAAGYRVQLSKDYVVISVTKIRGASGPSRIIQSVDGPVHLEPPPARSGHSRRPLAK